MLADLANLVITLVFWLLIVAAVLSLLALKWRLFRHLRDGYFSSLRVAAVGVATFLWRPEFETDGIGNYVEVPQKHDSPQRSSLSLYRRRAVITFLYHGCVVAIAAVFIMAGRNLSNPILLDMGAFVLLIHVLSFQRVPLIRVVQQRLVKTHWCVCGCAMLMEGRWRCKCQAVAIRHAFSKCPREGCNVGFDSLNCPNCQLTHRLT